MADSDLQRLFTRRALMLGGGQALGLALLCGRLIDLQVRKSAAFKLLADDNRIATRLLPPPRGHILDRTGHIVADNTQIFQLLVKREETKDFAAMLDFVATVLPIDDAARERIARDRRRTPPFTPVLLYNNLTWDQVAKIELAAPDWPGLTVEPTSMRSYPYTDSLAHLLGYVSTPNEEDAKHNPIMLLPNMKIGKSGVERSFEERLCGTAGQRQFEVNAHGAMVRELSDQPGKQGEELKLTIDLDLQQALMTRLAKEVSGAAVVLDVETGAVMAMGSHPGYDPNHFVMGIPQALWTELLNDERAPLTNKAIVGQYAPGSTFKPMVALAALESGLITPDYRVTCPGYMDIGTSRFHCWKHNGGHGTLNLGQALAQSCDVYFYDVAKKIGIDRMQAMAERFGFGRPTGFDILGERSGFMPSRAWKLRRFKNDWQLGDTLNASIGQGSVLATPLQLAVMLSAIVNGGNLVRPHVAPPAYGTPDKASTSFSSLFRDRTPVPLGLKPRNLQAVLDGLNGVVNDRSGTAYAMRTQMPNWAMGGKSGTSQVRRITKAERERGLVPTEQRPWHEREHALFIGFAPVDKPRYAVAVIVEHGGGGSHAAAPIARDVLIAASKLQGLDPGPASAAKQPDPPPPADADNSDDLPDDMQDDGMTPDVSPAPDADGGPGD